LLEEADMPWTPRDITDTELAVLRLLWSRGPSTIRELTDRLYPEGGHSHYATVQSLLDRLDQKGFVEREKQGRINVFTPRLTRAELIARRLRATADTLCGGSMAPLLTELVDSASLSSGELEQLRDLIAQLDSGGESSRGGHG
jgi:predicted transcriptional regulator